MTRWIALAALLWAGTAVPVSAATSAGTPAHRVHHLPRHASRASRIRATRQAALTRWHRGPAPQSPVTETREALGLRGGNPVAQHPLTGRP